MPLNLSAIEARIIGCLMEKSVVTPDHYPMTANALTNACNQKSARNPVMSLTQGEVQRTARELGAKHLVQIEENYKSGVEKYKQRFCNTTFSDYQFDPPQFAIICLLLLRGRQTPGELRAHSGRLHAFADNASVAEALTGLIDRGGDPLVVKLPRTPGRRDSEYLHLLSGPLNIKTQAITAPTVKVDSPSGHPRMKELEERVAALEAEVANLKQELKTSRRLD